MKPEILYDRGHKILRSPNYNYILNMSNGYFQRFGKDLEDDPFMSEFGPEILDLEISTSVTDKEQANSFGPGCKGNCAFCYKSNALNLPTHNLTFEEFKKIFKRVNYNRQLVSIAFGIMNYSTNPDFLKMAMYCRANDVMPTFTCHGLDNFSPEEVSDISKTFGAIAVSVYDKQKSYDTIKKLTDAGMSQVNIHFMLSEQTYEKALEVIEDSKNDPRLAKLNAIVFLSLKKKGRAEKGSFSRLADDKFALLIKKCLDEKVRFGMDSCIAPRFLDTIKDRENFEELAQSVESCESFGLFSSYINAFGNYYPCSFTEGVGEWVDGLSVLNCKDFMEEVWNNKLLIKYRDKSLNNMVCINKEKCRQCLMFDV